MNQPNRPITLPLEYVAQIVFELDSMRRECSELGFFLMTRNPVSENVLEECAQLDDALARAHGVLREALDGIKTSQARRNSNEQ
jgi:hypothetical protein